MAEQNLTKQENKFNRIANEFANEVSKNIKNVSKTITSQEAQRLTLALCVKANDIMEEQGIAWGQINANKFVVDAVKIAAMGLDASNNEVYAIPYKNKKSNKYDLDLTMSAWGWRKLVIQYGVGKKITDFKQFAISENDSFTVEHTPNDDIWSYKQNPFGGGKTIGYVTIACYADGTSNVMTHTKADIEKRRNASKAPNSPAWKSWYDEMAIAKALRRHCKQIAISLNPETEGLINQLDSEEGQAQFMIDQNANKEPLDFKDVTPYDEDTTQTTYPQSEENLSVSIPNDVDPLEVPDF